MITARAGCMGQRSANASDDQTTSLKQHIEEDSVCLQSFMSCTEEQDTPVLATLEGREPEGQPATHAALGHQVDGDSHMEGSPRSEVDIDTSQAQWEQRMMVCSLYSVRRVEL